MSETDRTYECPDCGRSIPRGHRCNCTGAKRSAVLAGHPDGPSVEILSGRPAAPKDEVEFDLR